MKEILLDKVNRAIDEIYTVRRGKLKEGKDVDIYKLDDLLFQIFSEITEELCKD